MRAAIRIGGMINAPLRMLLIEMVFAPGKEKRDRARGIASRLQRGLNRFRGIPFSCRIGPIIRHAKYCPICFQSNASLLNSKASLLRVHLRAIKDRPYQQCFSSTHHHGCFFMLPCTKNFPLQCVKLCLKQSAMLQAWLEAILSQSISGRQEKADRVTANRNILSLRFFLPGYFCVISPVVIPA